MFTTPETATRFQRAAAPAGQVARARSWHRVLMVLLAAQEDGARAFVVDPPLRGNVAGANLAEAVAFVQAQHSPERLAGRLNGVLAGVHALLLGTTTPGMPTAARMYANLARRIVTEWNAPTRVHEVLPDVLKHLESVEQALGDPARKVFVHDHMDEFSLWALEELERREAERPPLAP